MAKVQKTESGWSVLHKGKVVEDGLTNSQAWKLADKINNEPMNRQEHVHDWSAGAP